MSLINQLNATTEYYWLNTTPEDILNKASALLWKLMGNAIVRDNWAVKPHETVDGGKMIKVPLEYANSNRGGYGAQTVINQSKVNILDAARFRWAGVYGSNTLNLDDLTQNTGDAAIIDLTKVYKDSIIKAARIQMAEDIITTAADSTRINGLGDLFNTTTSTEYGSIDEAEMADWAASVITTAEAISFEVMQKIFREPNMGESEMMKPDFCVTTPTLRDGYERSLHPQQRYRDTKAVEAGWDNITHKGAPIVGDPYITSGYLEALNTRFLSLRSHVDYNFTTPVWVNKEVLGQPDVISANTRWRGNLFCSNRKLQVRHTNLTGPV
uniref:Putative capsid protein n=1 Tax=viral metagenome TaxID=1070528 RepID=A0A6H1ZUE5_9ZZZZ